MTTPRPARSPLDDPPTRFTDQPFYAETIALLRAVRDHDLPALAGLCDDDFGIVDVDPGGSARPVRDRAEWEAWFTELFATLDALEADTDSEILDYRALRGDDLGFAALEFRQTLSRHGVTASFDCVATLVWKRTPDGWREARWHASVISADVPEQLAAATAG